MLGLDCDSHDISKTLTTTVRLNKLCHVGGCYSDGGEAYRFGREGDIRLVCFPCSDAGVKQDDAL